MIVKPFKIFSWDGAFLPAVVQCIDKCSFNNAYRATIIVPNNRPKRYFTQIYRQKALADKGAVLLPNILTIQEVIFLLRSQCYPLAEYAANSLDRIALLYNCMQNLSQSEQQLCRHFKDMDMGQFLPWGQRLAGIFEDCFNQNILAQNLLYVEGEVSELASSILNSLGNIQNEYMEILRNKKWSTPAFDAYTIAQTLAADTDISNTFGAGLAKPLKTALQDELLFIVGFSTLTGVENSIMRYFWDNGAHICLHTDIDTVLGKGQVKNQGQVQGKGLGHWACSEHKKWLKKWGAKTDIIVDKQHQFPNMHYAQGYDLHSQIDYLKKTLSETLDKPEDYAADNVSNSKNSKNDSSLDKQAGTLHEQDNMYSQLPSTAIVLSDNKQLIPLLHALPHKNVNISMGYSLERNSLYDFIDAILCVHSGRKVDKGYYWVELQRILSHPYLQMLELNDENGENVNNSVQDTYVNESRLLRPILKIMLQNLNSKGARFIDPRALADVALDQKKIQPTEDIAKLLDNVLKCIFEQFSSLQNLTDLAQALLSLCSIFLQYGVNTWKSYPLDAEAIYKIVHDLCPLLQNSILSSIALPQETLHNILRMEVKDIRIPFEAEPITGLQIIGMLETRLLQFDRIFILDMTDDKIPGNPVQDQLLPDSLRILLGLPDSRSRDKVAAYNFFRLIASAKDVYICWQNSVQGSQLLDNRKVRSRFIDQLIWEEEKSKGELLLMGGDKLQNLSFTVSPVQKMRKSLLINSEMQKRLQNILQHKISATLLDVYLRCPLQFAFSRLMKIDEPSKIIEGENYALIGEVIHKVFEKIYAPWVQKNVEKDDFNLALFQNILEDVLQELDVEEHIPYDSFLMLKTASLACFEKYLKNQPAQTHIIGLESQLTSEFCHNNMNFNLYGKVDRIDKRANQILIIDYKTGNFNIPTPYIWQDIIFWEKISDNKKDMFKEIHNNFSSIQLAFYIYLANMDKNIVKNANTLFDAVFVELQDSGEEKSLFSDVNAEDIIKDAVENNIPNLLKYIILHIINACEFEPIEGKYCEYCIYEELCLR